MEHLITPKEISNLGRPMGNMDEPKIQSYINEAEQLNIKPVLGDGLFLDILSHGEENDKYAKLLSGGTYNGPDGNLYSFAGLKSCVAYFVFAKNIMVGDFITTRYGVVLKEADFSTHISNKERADAYNDALEVANCYLQDCVRYCRHTGILSGKQGTQRAIGGIKIRKIG